MISPSRTDRRGYILEAESWVPHSQDEVFAFFADAHQLETLTPAWLRFEVLTPKPVEMRPGALIDYRLKLYGLPLRWRSEITDWEPPRRFVDRQVSGPYRYWIHEHTFVAQNGGTLVRDRVEYAVPGGRLIHRFFVKSSLEKIFQFRGEKLRDVFA